MPNKYLTKLASDLEIARKSEGEELKAVKDYSERLKVIKDPELRRATEHAIKEEKDHAEDFGKVIDKEANLLVASGIGHLFQNALTNIAMRSRAGAKHVANQFATGMKGHIPAGGKNHVIRGAIEASIPDVSIMGNTANQLGQTLKSKGIVMNDRTRASLRMLSEGRFEDIRRTGAYNHPAVKAVLGHLKENHGIHIDPSKITPDQERRLGALWKDKKYPLLSNISKNLPTGIPSKVSKEGVHHAGHGLIASGVLGVAEPGIGLLSGIKHLATSHHLENTKLGKKVIGLAHKTFVKDPLRKGWEEGSAKIGLKDRLLEHIISPTTAHLKRTSGAIRNILSPTNP